LGLDEGGTKVSEIVRDVIERYEQRMPGAGHARQQDAQYAHQWRWMQSMLTVADMAMEDEGVPEDVRARVIRTVVYGGPDVADAELRMELNEAAVKRLAEQPPWLVVPDDLRR